MSEELVRQEKSGTITFATDVLQTIAGIAACDVDGVAGMSGGFKDDFVEMLGKKSFAKGIKVSKNSDDVLSIDIEVILNYGVAAPKVCANIQSAVYQAIDMMTGMEVEAINIFVQDIKFKEEPREVLEESAD